MTVFRWLQYISRPNSFCNFSSSKDLRCHPREFRREPGQKSSTVPHPPHLTETTAGSPTSCASTVTSGSSEARVRCASWFAVYSELMRVWGTRRQQGTGLRDSAQGVSVRKAVLRGKEMPTETENTRGGRKLCPTPAQDPAGNLEERQCSPLTSVRSCGRYGLLCPAVPREGGKDSGVTWSCLGSCQNLRLKKGRWENRL